MISKRSWLLYCAAFFVSVAAFAAITEQGTGIVFGSDHSFSLTAPEGWMLDNESGVKQGVHALFYPKGSTWKNSKIGAYARARPKTEDVATADDAAKAVVKDFHKNGNPGYTAKRVKVINTNAGKEAVIYHFWGDQWGNSQAAAYVVEAKTINFVTLTARKREAFEKALPAFEQLVASYTFLADQPAKTTKKLSAQFDEIRAAADRLSKTAEGNTYEKTFWEALGPVSVPILQACTGKRKGARSIDLVFTVADDGNVVQIVPAPEQKEAECVADKLTAFKAPRPPKPNWSIAVKIHVQ